MTRLVRHAVRDWSRTPGLGREKERGWRVRDRDVEV